MSIIFVFLDGLGLAPTAQHNPLSLAAMPHLRKLLGGALVLESAQSSAALLLRPIDATLGVDGLPQSGTGHVALLAGVNAPALHGHHQPNFPPVALRPLLAERSIFRRAKQAGQAATMANAFSEAYWQAIAARRMRRPASVIAAEGAGLRLRDLNDLRNGQAVSWDITGAWMQARAEDTSLPIVSPAEAGARLAMLAQTHDLVFFECSLPDLAGHGRLGTEATPEVLARIDGLFGGLLAARTPSDSVLMTSDHGNLEDARTPGHTRNPVPLLVVGPAVAHFSPVNNISEVADAIRIALRPATML